MTVRGRNPVNVSSIYPGNAPLVLGLVVDSMRAQWAFPVRNGIKAKEFVCESRRGRSWDSCAFGISEARLSSQLIASKVIAQDGMSGICQERLPYRACGGLAASWVVSSRANAI
jgi:hypothetical protein